MNNSTAADTKKFSAIIGFVVLVLAGLFTSSDASAIPQASTTNSAVAAFVGSDITTQGNWQGVYGSDGYVLAQSAQSIPSYASFSVGPHNQWMWASNTTDIRALSVPTGGRIAADWETPQAANASYSLLVNLTDGKSHQVAVYALDWDQYEGGRTETIQVVDANSSAILDTRTISSFSNGVYVIWNITGNVRINVTLDTGGDAVLSGIFFGGHTPAASAPSTPVPATSAVASFVGLDTTAEGNWQGVHGADGYVLAQSAQSIPSYASFSVGPHNQWMWASNTTDVRALSVPTSGRIAADWETPQASNASYSLFVNLTDGKSHQVAVYALDWDQYEGGRTETIQVVDANSNAILDTRTISSFSNGVYLIWNITGNVRINVTLNAGGDAVLSGIFFGGPTVASQPAPTPVTNASTLILSSSATSLSFGNVNVSSSSAQTVTLTNSGTGSVTISGVSVSGAGFNASGVSTGTILAAGQTATLSATFAPASNGSLTGGITVASNATNGALAIALSGTGVTPSHSVNLAWSPSSSTVVGYNVYVSTVSGSGYTKLTSSPVAILNYLDSGLETAQTRYYVVTSIDSNNDESAYSNQVAAVIP